MWWWWLVVWTASALVPQRVLVCGPAGSVADVVASELRSTEVVRWTTRAPAGAAACEAAVVCGDGSLAEIVEAMLAESSPKSVVIIAPADDPEEGGLFSSFLGKAEATPDELASRCEGAGATRVAVLRHGPLFGGDEAPAFTNGLRRSPTLSDEYGRRGVRLVPRLRSSSTAPTRRASLGRAAAETLASDQFTTSVEFEVRSVVGLGPSDDDEWRATVVDALAASDARCAFRISTASRGVDRTDLEDWILNLWGPNALRNLGVPIRGARPVVFKSPAPDDPTRVTSLLWEDFDGTAVVQAGELRFDLIPDEDLFLVTRDSDLVLPGEVALVDALADAFPDRFPLLVREEEPLVLPALDDDDDDEGVTVLLQENQTKAPAAPQAVVAAAPLGGEKEAAPVAATKRKVRRSSVRARTSSSGNPAPPDTPSSS